MEMLGQKHLATNYQFSVKAWSVFGFSLTYWMFQVAPIRKKVTDTFKEFLKP